MMCHERLTTLQVPQMAVYTCGIGLLGSQRCKIAGLHISDDMTVLSPAQHWF